MNRFLTPAKIGLLALIELYAEAAVPSTSTVQVLSFILDQVLPSLFLSSQMDGSNSAHSLPYALELKDFEKLLSAHPASGLPGRTLWDNFLRKLWELDSLDALQEFFARSTSLMARTREEFLRDNELNIQPPPPEAILFTYTSPVGSFVRRNKVEFERLRFDDVVKLWKALIIWRHETRTYWARRSGLLGRWAGDSTLDEGEEEWGPDYTEQLALIAYGNKHLGNADEIDIGTSDVEKLLEFQIEQIQKLGTRIPIDIKEKFRDLLNQSIIVPSLSHYLRFLDAWRARDYPSSFDYLHRYFDYTMQNRDRLYYQYALMNLAVLQAEFGCFEEAVAAMLETVSTARENKDMSCLNFALNWLYHFGKAHPKMNIGAESTNMLGKEKESLEFLLTKAKEAGMWTLWSSSLLSQALLSISSGDSIATAFENILKSSYLIVLKNLKSMMGPQLACVSSLWLRLGEVHLAVEHCEIFLRCHARYAVFSDLLEFTCRTAHLLALKGRYAEGMSRLDGLDENSLRGWKENQYWLKYRGILRLERELHLNNLEGSEHLLSQLLQSNSMEEDPHLSCEIDFLHVDYLMRRSDYSQALKKIEELSKSIQEGDNDVNLQVKVLVLKAFLLDKCGRPQKGFSIAVRAANIAWRARLISGLWPAMGAIANILTSLSEFTAASQILQAVIPRALELEDCALGAQLYAYLVDAHMGLAGQAAPDSPRRTEQLTRCLELIDRSFAEYSLVEDIRGQCEMMAKKATIMKLVGDPVLANDYASAYLKLKAEARR